MAIGLGRMFGFRFPENFRWPYIADSVQEFWRRWHMSLSTWFRDYLYIPLGGNRVSPARRYLNLVTVFFLCGLWHGASWNFVIWGLWHGAFLVVERVTFNRGPRARREQELSDLSGLRFRGSVVADLAARLHAARGHGRVGVLPRGDAARRARVPEGDGRRDDGGADAVHGVVVSDAGAVARARRRRDRIDAVGAGARGAARRRSGRGCRWTVDAAEHRDADGAARRVDHAVAARTYNPFIYFRF